MSDSQDPRPANLPAEPPYVLPAPRSYPPPRSSGSGWRTLLVILLAGSIAFNIILFLILLTMGSLGSGGSPGLTQRYHSGSPGSAQKIAILQIEGALMDGTMGYINRQLDEAAEDDNVKAVVLRIVSPGGSITASDDLHRRIVELRDGKYPRQRGGAKTVVVSMGAMAASGAYYVAVPAQSIFAETTTVTGSIGVYAAFPNVTELGKKIGFSMNLIKAGDVKASGSMFHEMKSEERYLWQELVDHAYDRFIEVVETGRPVLKGKMREILFEPKEIPELDAEGNAKVWPDGKPRLVKYIRRRADGGIYTAQDALKWQLIDEIGYLDSAVKKAASLAGLGDYRAITYDKPQSLASILFGQSPEPAAQVDAGKLADVATPRLWYMAPQAELSGLLSILR